MSDYLFDTCALLWVGWNDPLSEEAIVALDTAAQRHRPVYVSLITAWELGHLVSKNRLRLPISPARWFRRAIKSGGLTDAELSVEILADSCLLPGSPPRDPADRMIIATARHLDLTIITRDRLILAYSEEGHVRSLAC
ncbi:MAG: type II toxin-antitoxin system VapC family toxin [Rhodobacteraceae bacterium]|nr:type II toxin-antitoxin system VapC family toxin [Paracoccaceae bacterium]